MHPQFLVSCPLNILCLSCSLGSVDADVLAVGALFVRKNPRQRLVVSDECEALEPYVRAEMQTCPYDSKALVFRYLAVAVRGCQLPGKESFGLFLAVFFCLQ